MARPQRHFPQRRRGHPGARILSRRYGRGDRPFDSGRAVGADPRLQPILTSTLANRWLGERVTPLQWAGLLLGLGGVVLILHNRPMSGEAGWGWLASGVSLVSITLGTLYQRRYCNHIDWRAGVVRYITVTVFFGIGAWLFENNVVTGPWSSRLGWSGWRWCCRSDRSGCCIG